MEITAKPFEALDASKQADGLIPAIVQDDRTLQVLMLGYMNREAYEKSLTEGRVTFYSRTRQCLWTKGETSGNRLDIVSVAADCDRWQFNGASFTVDGKEYPVYSYALSLIHI